MRTPLVATPALALVLALAAAPAFAGTVYLPVVAPDGDGGQKTVVTVTNDDPATPRRFTGFLLPLGSDGVAATRTPALSRTIEPGQTVLVELDSHQTSALLEINAAPQLSVGARLENLAGTGGEALSVPLPVVSSANLVAAGEAIDLQGWQRAADGARTNLGLLNLGQGPAVCQFDLFGAGGESRGSAELRLAPLSLSYFRDGLRLLGVSSIRDAHSRITCDQPSFAWLDVFDGSAGSFRTLLPAANGKSTLRLPGDDGSAVGDPPTTPHSVLFVQRGTFHTATPGDETWVRNVALPADTRFDRVTVDFDVTPGPWSYDPTKTHSLFWLHRGVWLTSPWNGNIFGFVNAFGPGKDEVKVLTNVDAPKGTRDVWSDNVVLEQGKTYHVAYVWDGQGGFLRLTITDKASGEPVFEVEGSTLGKPLTTDASGSFFIYFGHEDLGVGGCMCGPERPSYGWSWSDLRLEFVRP